MDNTYGANSIFFIFYKAVAPTVQEDLQITFKQRYLPHLGLPLCRKTK
jgi:hypothetical protein